MERRRASSLTFEPLRRSSSASTRRYSSARNCAAAGELGLCGRWRKSTYIPGKFRFMTKQRFRAESQIEENRKPSNGSRCPVKPNSRVVFTMEQMNEPKRASACWMSRRSPAPLSPTGSMTEAWINSTGEYTGKYTTALALGWAGFHSRTRGNCKSAHLSNVRSIKGIHPHIVQNAKSGCDQNQIMV